MSYYSKHYQWHFENHRFWCTYNWPKSYWSYVLSLRHDVLKTSQYAYYIENEPFKEDLSNFFEYVLEIVDRYVEINSETKCLKALLSFVQYLEYYKDKGGEYPRYPSETLINGGGDCEDTAILMGFIAKYLLDYDVAFLDFKVHVDLGIVEKYKGEFTGTYWEHNGKKYFYVSCNGKGRSIGDYSGNWGNYAYIYPIEIDIYDDDYENYDDYDYDDDYY